MTKPLFRRLHDLRLKHKIALLCTLLVVVSTSFSGALLYHNAADITTESASVHSSEVLQQAGNYLNEKLKSIITRGYALRTDSTFNTIATRYLISDETQYYASALSYFSSVFQEMRYSEPFISSVYLYTPKASFYDLSMPYRSDLSFMQTSMYKQIASMPEASVYWLPRLPSELYRQDSNVISLVLRFSVNGYSEDLYMVISLKEEAILQYLHNVQSEDGSFTSIIDKNNQAIASINSPLVQHIMEDPQVMSSILSGKSGSLMSKQGSNLYMLNYTGINVAPWTLVHVQSQKSLLDKLYSMKVYSSFILLVSITFSFGIAVLISSNISKPLALLEKSMNKVRFRQFDVQFEYPYEDEVGKLGRSFNIMKEEIHNLIRQKDGYISQLQMEQERVYAEQRLKRIAEIRALQSQMTPHFLYNTLDSIKWMAEKNNQFEISQMITALALFFRTSLNKGKEMIPLSEEVAHATSYLTIQEMRYRDRFTYEFHVDRWIENQLVPNFILQPLIENAIYHGIKPMEKQGRIRIRTESAGDCMLLSVEDNGAGIHPVKLQLIRKRFQTIQADIAEGYGLYNVNDRLKLIFGEEYGLDIESESGMGTKVTARVPLAPRKEESGPCIKC
jgi:two-component system sensor histidine kinase YesM